MGCNPNLHPYGQTEPDKVPRHHVVNHASSPLKRCSGLLFLTAIANALRWPINTTSKPESAITPAASPPNPLASGLAVARLGVLPSCMFALKLAPGTDDYHI